MLFRKKEEKKSNEQPVAVLGLRRKGVALAATFILLVILIVVGTVAWYTRLATVQGMTFNVAKFGIGASSVDKDDTLQIYVDDFLNVQKDKAAPGTGGVIPVKVSLMTDDEVGADYTVSLDLSGVAPEFLQRLRFYYYTKDSNGDGKPDRHELGGTRYTYTESGDNYTRSSEAKKDKELEEGGYYESITGSLDSTNQEKYEFIYWEWIYELDKDVYNLSTGEWETNEATASDSDKEAHNEFDTAIGLGDCDKTFRSEIDPIHFTFPKNGGEAPEGDPAYQDALLISLNVLGAQAVPERAAVGQTAAEFKKEIEEVAGEKPGSTVYVNPESGSESADETT